MKNPIFNVEEIEWGEDRDVRGGAFDGVLFAWSIRVWMRTLDESTHTSQIVGLRLFRTRDQT